MKKILLVEDDDQIAELVSNAVKDGLSFATERTADGIKGLEYAQATQYELIILDISLPSMSGFDICRELRSRNCTTPIIMLTARADELDRVLGLELGSDDYLIKPFSSRELVSRIKAILRRTNVQHSSRLSSATTLASSEPETTEKHTLTFGGLSIDTRFRKVSYNGKKIDLTATEYDLLLFFALKPGVPFTRDELISGVLGYETSNYESSITTHLCRMRMKIEPNPSEPKFIKTVRGVGYRFVLPEELL